jgi:hypothetical protein
MRRFPLFTICAQDFFSPPLTEEKEEDEDAGSTRFSAGARSTDPSTTLD